MQYQSDDDLGVAGNAFRDYVLVPLAERVDAAGVFQHTSGIHDSIRDLANYELPTTISAGPFESVVQYFSEPISRPVEPPRLVGIELNPGPPKVANKLHKLQNEIKQETQALHQAAKAVSKQHPPARNKPQSNPQNSLKNPVSVATAYSSNMKIGKPKIVRNSDDSVTISHTELVNLVAGTATWTTTGVPMQPGLGSTFQWLSSQTAGWEKYKWNKLEAIYVTRCGSNISGTVMLIPDYDAADPAPLNELAAASYHGASDDVPWKNQFAVLDMKRSKELFLRNGPLSANLDIKTYDFGNLWIATTDGSVASWGKVFIRYTVTLYNSQVIQLPNTGGTITADNAVVALAPATPLAGGVITPGSYIQSIANGNVVSLVNLIPGQKYFYAAYLTGTGLTAVNTAWTNFTASTNVGDNMGTATFMADSYVFIATSQTATITVSGTGTTVTFSQFYFCPLNSTTR